jgi:hypothetical protein
MSDRCASDHRLEGLASTTHAAPRTGGAASTLNADCAFLGARHHRAGSLVIKEEHAAVQAADPRSRPSCAKCMRPPGAEALDCASVRECPPSEASKGWHDEANAWGPTT